MMAAVMRKLPPLNAVRAFEVAARHVSFTKAADELHVTHGAVSRQVALLESWLGAPLFRRTSSQLVLTDVGRAYMEEIGAALDRVALASTHVKQRVRPSVLRLNAPPTFAMRWLIPRLSTFQRRHPEIEVRLTTALGPVRFSERDFDMAIRGAHEPMAGCRSEPFMRETIVPVCQASLRAHGGLAAPADLARHTLIGYGTEPYAWADWLRAAGVPDLRPAKQLNFEQMFFALQAAAEGLGVVLVPLFLVIDDIAAGRLCCPFGALGAMHRHYYVSSPASAVSPSVERAVGAFREWLMQEGRDSEAVLGEREDEALRGLEGEPVRV
jgi:LysR family glycine cleavage system transcriptional activator